MFDGREKNSSLLEALTFFQGEVNEDLSEQKLKMKQQEFENSFKQKLKVLAPVSIGCVWPDVVDSFAKSSVMTLRNYEVPSR